MRTTEQAKNAMVDLYASILSFLAKTRRYFAKNSLSKQCILFAMSRVLKRRLNLENRTDFRKYN